MRHMLVVVILLAGVVAMPRAWAAEQPREVSVEALHGPQARQVEVFVRVHASPAQIAAVHNAVLRDGSQVLRFAHLSKEDAYSEFRRLFSTDPNLVARTKPSDLPESFRLDLRAGVDRKAVRRKFKKLRGVGSVVWQMKLPAPGSAQFRELCDNAAKAQRDFDANKVHVFMNVAATTGQVAAVRAAIVATPGVAKLQFLDHEAALREFRKLFPAHPKLLASTRASDLPESFDVSFADPDSVNPFYAQMQKVPGVYKVTTPAPPGVGVLQACAEGRAGHGR